jgi:hypothetical protein
VLIDIATLLDDLIGNPLFGAREFGRRRNARREKQNKK